MRKDWIETLVFDYTIKLVNDVDQLEFIAEQTHAYYLEQNTDSHYTKSFDAALDDVNKSMFNLIRAIDTGIFRAN